MSSTEEPKLEKVISYRNYVTLGLGIVIGVGWVVYSGQWLKDGGPLGAMIAFGLGGLLLMPIGKCYAELTSAIPVAGGELAFSYKAFGPLFAFLTGWALSLGYVTLAPFETIAIGGLFEVTFPALKTEPLYYVGEDHVSLSTLIPGLLTGGYLTWLNIQGAKKSTSFQGVMITLLFGCSFIFTGVAIFNGDLSNLMPFFAREGNLWAVAPASIISVLVVVPWFMSGFDAIPQAAEEAGLKLRPNQLGKAILLTIAGGALFYVVIILAVSISMPWQTSANLPWTTAEVFKAAFGYEWAAQLVLIAALIGIISTLNGMIIASTRLLFAMGRGGLLPHWFGLVDKTHHTPKNAILFVGLFSLIGPFIGTIALGPIVNSSSLTFTTVLFITCIVAIKLRKIAPEMERPFKTNLFTLYFGALVGLTLILLMVLPQSAGQLAPHEFMIILGWIVLGYIFSLWRKKSGTMDIDQQANQILGKYR